LGTLRCNGFLGPVPPSGGACPLVYARSKSCLGIPRSLLISCSVPVARSRFPCLGIVVWRALPGLRHISWEPCPWRT
jgi:hypothetical protein